jgi:hypothetical protein
MKMYTANNLGTVKDLKERAAEIRGIEWSGNTADPAKAAVEGLFQDYSHPLWDEVVLRIRISEAAEKLHELQEKLDVAQSQRLTFANYETNRPEAASAYQRAVSHRGFSWDAGWIDDKGGFVSYVSGFDSEKSANEALRIVPEKPSVADLFRNDAQWPF